MKDSDDPRYFDEPIADADLFTHETFVVEYLTSGERHKAGQAQAECRSCGKFGPVCDYYEDARSIADRHRTIGGFER